MARLRRGSGEGRWLSSGPFSRSTAGRSASAAPDRVVNRIEKSPRLLAHHVTHAVRQANADGLKVKGQVLGRPVGFVLGHELTLNPFYSTETYRSIAHLPFEQKLARLRDPEIRARICAGLEWMGLTVDAARNDALTGGREGLLTSDDSRLKAWVIPTDEELLIARDTFRVVTGVPARF